MVVSWYRHSVILGTGTVMIVSRSRHSDDCFSVPAQRWLFLGCLTSQQHGKHIAWMHLVRQLYLYLYYYIIFIYLYLSVRHYPYVFISISLSLIYLSIVYITHTHTRTRTHARRLCVCVCMCVCVYVRARARTRVRACVYTNRVCQLEILIY